MAALIAANAGCTEAPPEANRIEVGAPAPEYAAVDLAGDSVWLAELKGRVVLLNVWATWCVPCRVEIPALQALYEANAERGLEVVGVSVDGRGATEAIRQFAADYDVTFTVWHDPEYRIGSEFRTLGIPTTFLLDGEGTIRWMRIGPVSAEDPTLDRALTAALDAIG